MLCSHLKALLKKNLLIAKSTFVLTSIEILAPIIIMLALLGLKSLFKKEDIPFDNDIDYIFSNTSIVYNSLPEGFFSEIEDLEIFEYLFQCYDRNIIAFVGKDFPINLANKFIRQLIFIGNIKYKYYEKYETLSDYVESEEYGADEGEICYAVSFKKENNKYIFKLHYYASPYSEDDPPEIPTTYMGVGNRLSSQPDYASYAKYAQSGFFRSQKNFYDYVLQEETGNPTAEINAIIYPKKYEEYINDPFARNCAMLLGMFSIIAYAGPLIINIYRIVKEKETKAKEGMKIMGLNELTYFLSNFIIYFIKNIIYSGFITLILSYAFKKIESSYFFLIYFLYGLVIYALIFFFQSFLERTIIAMLVTLLIYVLMYFFFIVVFQNSINYAAKFIFCILFPPTALQLGINTISNFETNFRNFDGRIYFKFNNFSVCDMYKHFTYNFIIYMFLGFFLQNVLPHEYGIKQPIYFLFTKSFWGFENNDNNDINIILSENNKDIIENNNKENNNSLEKNKNNEIIIDIKNNNLEDNIDKKDSIKNEKDKKQINLDENNNNENPRSSDELINQNLYIKVNSKTSDHNKKEQEKDGIKSNFESEEFYKMNYTQPRDSLKIRNICKIFDDGKKALNNVSFNIYKNEIFALLGHNGAGKSTLISILSGLYPATSGYAIYDNQNIITTEGHSKFKKYLGICPQHDVLFDDLTVKEHLEMFCVFKSVQKENIEDEIDKILIDFDLLGKKDAKACHLSGGQKRKLSICIALVGGSSVIFLDEPTSGMDITSRRNLWDILKRYAGGRIIILTTHYMEEAAVLGNRIGILSEGDMKCIGSPLFLIERFGKNINLNIAKQLEANNESIINFIKDNIKDIEYEIYNKEILFRIPKNNIEFSGKKFFKILDENYKKLGIKNYSLSMSTLEDVFINVSKLTRNKNKKILDSNGNLIDEEEKKLNEKREKNYLILYNDNNYNAKYSYFQKILLDTKVSFKKRFIQIYRDKKIFFLEILCPIFLAFIGCLVCYLRILEKNQTVSLNVGEVTTDRQTMYYYNPNPNSLNNDEIIKIFQNSLEKNLDIEYKEINVRNGLFRYNLLVNFMNKIFENEQNEKKINYANYIFDKIDKENHKYDITLLTDILLSHSTPIYFDYMAKNIIRYATNKPNLDIEVINEPLPYTNMEKNDSKERNSTILLVFISICFTLIPANFVTIIIREKENNSKHLQIISGISLMSYWVNNFIFELAKYYIIGGICLGLLEGFGFYEDYVIVLYILYGPPMVAFTYIIGSLVKREGTGQVLVILINLALGAVGGTAIFIMRLYQKLMDTAIPLAKVFRIIPSFCFCYGYNTLLDRFFLFAADLKNELEGIISWGMAYLIVMRSKKPKDVLDLKYIGGDLIYLGIESVVYILILIFIENSDKIFSRCFTSNVKPKNENKKLEKEIIDNNHVINIIEEGEHSSDQNQANNIKNESNIDDSKISIPENVNDTYVKNEIIKAKSDTESNNAIKIINLIKDYYGGPFGFKIFNSCFKTTKAVRDISLCLNYGDCFGFLGVNGAGKTTTFKCLSKEILPTYGKIYIDNKEINEEFDKVRTLIGYCPQFDAIFESLTVYENLEFYGLIKGAKKDKINSIIEALMDEMNLEPFKNIPSGKLSGGNKRKLSVAIAIICNPPIILLDEPSTGMDPEARRYMWGVIHRISINSKKSTIIMTTHSMEEAETLCKRIAIMVDGQFKCLGTSDEIKEKYGYGFEINLQINNPNYEELFKKYKISEEDKEAQINLNNITTYLEKYNLNHFNNELSKDRLGGKIIEEINFNGYVYLSRILSWIYFLENALKMIQVILLDFPEIHCSDYGENNFVFKIKRNRNEDEKSIGYLFGIIEENNIKFNIQKYFLQLTSLEQIFNNFAKETERPENKINDMRNIDIPINNELINILFK